jgi:predicted restriction endonuclease
MPQNVIITNLNQIKKRHYTQKATSGDYWVAFYKRKMDYYKSRFGEDFNLIIYGDENRQDDFISIPYSELKDFLTDYHIDEIKQRWVFSIENENLRVHRNVKRLNIREYRGNPIDIQELYPYHPVTILNQLRRDKVIRFEKKMNQISQEKLVAQIRSIEGGVTYREGTIKYYQRKAIVAEYAKRRANGICQLCHQPAPFIDRQERPFLEAHHIVWLSKGGEDIPENTAALCPNCHRKMHLLNLQIDRETILSNII